MTLDHGIVFNIAENLLEKEHKLTLYSLNPVYGPFDVNVNEIKEVWKFVNYISSRIPDPVLPEEELVKTVANLKHDMDILKKTVLLKKDQGL